MFQEPCKKKAFKDLRAAHKALTKIQSNQKKRQFTPIRAYTCEICGNYHLTHHERLHWLINTDFRVEGKPASPEIIKNRIEELSKIVEQKKIEEENARNMERSGDTNKIKKGNKCKVRGEQHRKR